MDKTNISDLEKLQYLQLKIHEATLECINTYSLAEQKDSLFYTFLSLVFMRFRDSIDTSVANPARLKANQSVIDNIEKDMSNILQLLDIKLNDIYISRFRTDISVPLYMSCRLCDKEYFIKIIYQNGLAQLVEEANHDDNKQVSLKEILKLSAFVGGTKTANVNNNNSVICEYNDSNLNRFGLIKNKSTNTIEVYGSKKYISYSNGNKPEEDLAKYRNADTAIAELTKELMPYLKNYLYQNIIKNNGRSK